MERSAWDVTVVWMVALVLLPAFGSPVWALTEAELASVTPSAGAVTKIVMSGAAPTARLARVHVTVVVPLQVQPLPVTLTSVTPAGRASVTVTAEAVSGPALLILSV